MALGSRQTEHMNEREREREREERERETQIVYTVYVDSNNPYGLCGL